MKFIFAWLIKSDIMAEKLNGRSLGVEVPKKIV